MRLTTYRYLPMYFFGLTYLITCYIGAALLLWGPPSVRYLYKIFSGVDVPIYTSDQLLTLLVLLHLPVVCLFLGFAGGLKLWGVHSLQQPNYVNKCEISCTLPWLWLLSLSLGVFSLWRGDAFSNVGAWVSSYDSWIAARWMLFGKLTLVEFINLYVLLPLASSGAALYYWKDRRRWLALLVILSGFAATLLLFQKKQPLVFLIVVTLPFWLAKMRAASGPPKSRLNWGLLLGGPGLMFLVLLFLPTLGLDAGKKHALIRGDYDLSKAVEQGSKAVEQSPQRDLTAFIEGYRATAKAVQYAAFAVNSVIFRTSAPAMHYPLVFPERHSFFGIDLPFDQFTPNDNRVVWQAMWPKTPGGSVSAPFQFGLYAQIGIAGTLALSLLLGAGIGVAWAAHLGFDSPNHISLMAAAQILLLSIYLGIDSLRDSLISSYGVIWGLAFIGGLMLISRMRAKGWPPSLGSSNIKGNWLSEANTAEPKRRHH